MALAELQAALARLTTDPAARALFVGDAEAFAREVGLGLDELEKLREMADDRLHLFAHSLLRKRALEAGRVIPLTRDALGDRYAKLFEAYSATCPVARDPGLDATTFLRWIAQQPEHPPELLEKARYELAWVLMRRGQRRFKLGVYRLGRGTRRFAAVWWRPRRAQPVQYYQWPTEPPREGTALPT